MTNADQKCGAQRRRKGWRWALTGVVVALILVFGAWSMLHPVDTCETRPGGCPPIIGLERGATLWLTPRQPAPGDVFKVVRAGNLATAELRSNYLSKRPDVPIDRLPESLNHTVSINDAKGVQASTALLKKFIPAASAEISRARSISLEASETAYQAVQSRSAFLTWLQDEVDRKPRHSKDGDDLMVQLRRPIPPTTDDDRPTGELYVVTEVLSASTIKYSTSTKQVDAAAVDCGSKGKTCKTLKFGRDINSQTGSSIAGAKRPIVFWVKMFRVGANPKDKTLYYDESRSGPLMVGH